MARLNPELYADEDFAFGLNRTQHRLRKYRPNHQPKQKAESVVEEIAGPDGRESFSFSYNASRHERQWLLDALEGVYEQHWIDDVLRLIKGGKEASVYQCSGNATSGADYLAAKIYRPRRFRSLKNDHLYREGRMDLDADGNLITDDGSLYAIRSRSNFGRQLMHISWIEYEFQALTDLHAAGADVPRPYTRGQNAILMEYIGGPEMAGVTLNTVSLPAEEAHRLFERVLVNIELMLAHGRVHGDLSAYNILYWEGEITLIDFPQVVAPGQNRSAWQIFARDVQRVAEYFQSQGVRVQPASLARKLWQKHGYRLRPELDPAHLEPEDEGDRLVWNRRQR